METFNFDKEFFQRSWGADGYYEQFNYGVGFDAVAQRCLVPFFAISKTALEIGSGGGVFTEKMVPRFAHTTAIDVIQMPEKFAKYSHYKFSYIELPDKCYSPNLANNHFDFAFSYNCFCHLSNDALREYLIAVQAALKPGGDFVFMLANWEYSKKQVDKDYNLGELLPFGHFCQDERTLGFIVGEGWKIVNPNMIPEHRDLIVHLRKI